MVIITNAKDRTSSYYSGDEKDVFMTPDSPWQGSTFEERWKKLREDRHERKKSLKKLHAHKESSDTSTSNDSSLTSASDTASPRTLSTPTSIKNDKCVNKNMNSENNNNKQLGVVGEGLFLPHTSVELDLGFSDVLDLYANKEAQFFMREPSFPSDNTTVQTTTTVPKPTVPKMEHSALRGPAALTINTDRVNELRPSISHMSLAEVAEKRRASSNSGLFATESPGGTQESREKIHDSKLEKLQNELDSLQEKIAKIKSDIKTLSVVLDDPTQYYMLGVKERTAMKEKREQLSEELDSCEKKKYEVGILFSKAWKRRRDCGLSDFWVRDR